jgi:hypothetical protein
MSGKSTEAAILESLANARAGAGVDAGAGVGVGAGAGADAGAGRMDEGSDGLDEALGRKPTASERRKRRLAARRRGRGIYKSRALARAVKKAMRRTPKSKLRLRAKRALKTRKRRYGESAIDKVRSVLEDVMSAESMVLTDEGYQDIKDNLMVHLNECVADGLESDELYAIVLNDIAPVMQVVESVMAREGDKKGKIDERDEEYLDSYCEYLDEVAEEVGSESGEGSED